MKSVHIFFDNFGQNNIYSLVASSIMYEYFFNNSNIYKVYIHDIHTKEDISNTKIYKNDIIVFINSGICYKYDESYINNLIDSKHEVIFIGENKINTNTEIDISLVAYNYCINKLYPDKKDYYIPKIIKDINELRQYLWDEMKNNKITSKNFFYYIFNYRKYNIKYNIFNYRDVEKLRELEYITYLKDKYSINYCDFNNGFVVRLISINNNNKFIGYFINSQNMINNELLDKYDFVCNFYYGSYDKDPEEMAWTYLVYGKNINCELVCDILDSGCDNLGVSKLDSNLYKFNTQECLFDLYGKDIIYRKKLFSNKYKLY